MGNIVERLLQDGALLGMDAELAAGVPFLVPVRGVTTRLLRLIKQRVWAAPPLPLAGPIPLISRSLRLDAGAQCYLGGLAPPPSASSH